MRAAIEYDLWLAAHTTADLSDPLHPRRLAEALKELYGLADLRVTWLPPRAQAQRSAAWDALDAGELAEIYGRGGINISDPAGELFQATLDWARVPPRDRENYLRNLGRRQNRLTLTTDKERLAEPGFRRRYLDFASGEARALDANLLYAYDRHVSDDRYRTAEGIGAGLRDVYWLNLYGPPFVELIGAERLLSAPAAETARMDGHVLLLAPDEVLDSAAAAAPIRAHIGREFFVPAGMEAGRRSLFGRKGGFHDDTGAERRPAFDWSGIFGS